jgi:TPR repeat protein
MFINQYISKLSQYLFYSIITLIFTYSTVQAASTSCINLYEQQKFTLAFKTCSIEANHHSINAHYILGKLYMKGLGVKQQTNKALSYYRQAVLNNDVDSQLALGQYHSQNNNPLQSHIFFTLALDNGSLNALHYQDKIAKQLSPNELELSKDFLELIKNAIDHQKRQVVSN